MTTPILEGSLLVNHGSVTLQLLPDRAVYFPACRTLIIADVHAGKGTAFRDAGLPIPVGSTQKDLKRIDRLLEATNAERLVILGDFLHAKGSRQTETMEMLKRWRDTNHRISVMLIRGNHDRSAGRVPGEWNIEEVEEPFDEGCGILFAHAPRDCNQTPMLCGHVHPVVSVRDFDRSTVRVPCFWFDGRGCGVLPAFGSLTGGYNVGIREGERVYLAMPDKVIPAERVQTRLIEAS